MKKYVKKVIKQNNVYFYVLDIYDEKHCIVVAVPIDSLESIEELVKQPMQRELQALIVLLPSSVSIVDLTEEQENMLNDWYIKNKLLSNITIVRSKKCF